MEDFLSSAPTGPPDPEDSGNHDTRGTNDLKVVNIFIPDSTGKNIKKAWPSNYPLPDVFVRKVKMLKLGFVLGKLMSFMEKPLGMGQVLK